MRTIFSETYAAMVCVFSSLRVVITVPFHGKRTIDIHLLVIHPLIGVEIEIQTLDKEY